MDNDDHIDSLPKHFRDEHNQLVKEGLTTWKELRDLTNPEIDSLVRTGKSSPINLRRLRGIAQLMLDIGVKFEEAALLVHAGLATIKVLATSTPEELIKKTGRLERQLGVRRKPLLNLAKAHALIELAKSRQTLKLINKPSLHT
ncbi:DUF4332 domain-containing protein [Prochlorococcus sp. MIT 1300]|uniref:DUF4332 domain-containing protein n=1 Tax=Prochlorococcus sp. MIT 1300 TaxID=3096218 RepID=UPI002A7591B3|nr:DUF4332 domain-containing protein [Prochlorococcus sp. MIT 1300]